MNEVQQDYDTTYGQMVKEYQSHSGAVNTGTSWNVDYAFDDSVSSNIFTNQLRLESTTYHDGKIVYRDYGSGGSLNDLLGRVKRIRETNSSGTIQGEYTHTADGRLVQTNLKSMGISVDYHSGNNDGVYERLDRFGRITKQAWHKPAGNPTWPVNQAYTYDRLGNRLTRDISSGTYPGNDQDQKFVYDELNRLVQFEEGTLDSNDTISFRRQEQQWDRDQLGNWENFKERDKGSIWDTDEDREHNAANEITSIDSVSNTVVYDAAGNMTRIPDLASGDEGIYDAWNRLVIIAAPAAGLQQNEYDGLHRRIVRDDSFAGGNGDKIHFYYSGQQVVEERKEVSGTIDTDPLNVYIYHPHYIDAVLCRDYDPETDGSSDRYHYLYDTTFNVTALVDDNKDVVERYHYDPYGKVTILDADFSADSDNKSDIGNEILFTSRRLDPETGLMYFRARYYHPGLGRFISRDPWGTIDGMNLYRGYFAPNGMDPWGLFSDEEPVLASRDPHNVCKGICERKMLRDEASGGNPTAKDFVACVKNCIDNLEESGWVDENGNPFRPRVSLAPSPGLLKRFFFRIALEAIRKHKGKPTVAPTPQVPTPASPPPSPPGDDNDGDEQKLDCTKARPFHLKGIPIPGEDYKDEHDFKTAHGACPNSAFDICACKDGSVVIRAVGQCGKSGPTIPTGETWK